MDEKVNHPPHYGGDVVYEAIKVISAWGLGFNLGNAAKYICRAGKKPGQDALLDLRKARFYLNHEIARLEVAEGKETVVEPAPAAVPVCKRCRQLLSHCRKWPAHGAHGDGGCAGSDTLSSRAFAAPNTLWAARVGRAGLWCSPVFGTFPSGFEVTLVEVDAERGLLRVCAAGPSRIGWASEPFYVLPVELKEKLRP